MQIVRPAHEQLSDDEVAAAFAAVQVLLSEEQSPATVPDEGDSGWRSSARLAVQKLQPAKTQTVPRWSTIERLRRAIGGRYDVRSF